MKKIRCILIFILVLIIFLCIIMALFNIVNKDKDQHEILAKKFYIPIKKSYEIAFFENVTGNDLKKHCYAELKLSESEYTEFYTEMLNAEYSIEPLDWYKIYFENMSDWISGEKVVSIYINHVVETEYIIKDFRIQRNCYRIQMNIFVTESKEGYRQIYMSRN